MPRGSTSTSSPKPTLEQALGNVPDQFRKRLIPSFLELKTRFREGKLDAAGLSAGKFCETVIRLLQHQLTGKFVPFGDKIPNLADACSALEKTPSSPGIESLRVIIPRALLFLYTLRNKRGIGHVGGDVDANRIDLATIMRAADWIVCELIRVFHTLSLEEAQDIVEVGIRFAREKWALRRNTVGVAIGKRIASRWVRCGRTLSDIHAV